LSHRHDVGLARHDFGALGQENYLNRDFRIMDSAPFASLPGARSRKFIVRTDGTTEVLSSKCDHVKVNAGDLLHYITWGGGGWGDPLRRDPALVAAETARGLISIGGARRYGVVLGPDSVDEAATRKLRETMAAGRGRVFDFGPPVEELKRNCQDETGLPAPAWPRFTRAVQPRG
jgi:N-methylhydantoinase B